jgi:hypothetical protein
VGERHIRRAADTSSAMRHRRKVHAHRIG